MQILIFHKKYFGSKLEWIHWHETAIFTKHKHVTRTWENSLKYGPWQLSFAFSYKWCYIIEKNEKRDGTLQWTTVHEIRSQCQHKPAHWVQHNNSKNMCVRLGCLCKACKNQWCYVETLNDVRDVIFSNYLVTKTNPMELNKRHKHWN